MGWDVLQGAATGLLRLDHHGIDQGQGGLLLVVVGAEGPACRLCEGREGEVAVILVEGQLVVHQVVAGLVALHVWGQHA